MRFEEWLDADEIQLSDLMNVFGFGQNGVASDEDRFDCNFISLYNEQDDDFDYFVERLCGIAIENSNEPRQSPALWHVYINEKLEDWSAAVRFGRRVCPSDQIEWRLHRPSFE